ncbi:TIR domain-containing protein [Altererythrobacter salegens]|uniref:TIR domain-containing protein n=1 Tax=Croceibacterium salegens TaxID=1737568 RepID=A0A6I4SYD4_9SPHN|nr:toll/interleukin-1 receptor domain-containing protein [Croceibacterium salegens]MXO61055.1 TIR domain-containing protein [Croceibacterium salegens]
MSGPDIFLSYNRADAARAKQFADALAAEGFSVWWDATLRSGETYDTVTERALEESRAVVVLWSPNSINSRWVRAEATEADRAHKLVPAMIAPCKRPIMFELTQTAELSHWNGDRSDAVWQAFVSDLRRHIGKSGDTPIPAPTSPTSDNGGGGTRHRTGRGAMAIAAVSLALALLVAGVYFLRSSGASAKLTEQPVQVATFAAEGGPAAALLATTMKNTAQEILGDAGYRTLPVEQPDGDAGFALKGTAVATGGRVRVFAQIEHLPSGETVWSGQFEDAEANADLVAVAASVVVAESLNAVRDAEKQDGLKLASKDIAAFIEGGNATAMFSSEKEGRARRIFEELVRRLPGSAHAHAMLALSLNDEPARRTEEIEKAIALDPAAAGAAFDARYIMERGNNADLAKQEDLLLDALRQAPEFPFLSMRECNLLGAVGRLEEAREHCVRAMAMRPTASPIGWRKSLTEDLSGNPGLARETIDRMVRYHPDLPSTQSELFRLYAFGDDPAKALDVLPVIARVAPDATPGELSALEQFVRARISGSAADKSRAASAIAEAVRLGQMQVEFAAPALVLLGQPDAAFGLLDARAAKQARSAPITAFLFGPTMAPLRQDPRFWRFATQAGLVDYWNTRGVWPDFCGTEVPLARCKALAAVTQA